jgi:cytochrome d ubiquinol oxidase subunit I
VSEKYKRFAKFWTRVFALTFAMGVATGIVMEFEFGTNWAHYSRYVGDVFGSALAAEGVFAFFLESGFLAILLFGWDRVSPRIHFFSTLMVCLGAHFSAVWIVVANSWMQTPDGYHIVGQGMAARAEIVDFWAMVFNPSSMVRLAHTVFGCWLAGAFLAISVSAYYLLKRRHPAFSKTSMKAGLAVAIVATTCQLITGDLGGRIIAKYQPAKLAALEGVYSTEAGAPMYVFGIPNTAERRVDYALYLPKMLSYLVWGDSNATVQGLDKVPEKDWPRVGWVFQSYHIMLYMWGIMVGCTLLGFLYLWRRTLFEKVWFLRILVFSVLAPQIANQAGWMAAEMGRYPWIVYNLLRISDGLSKSVTANQILGSLIMFTLLYILLFVLFVYMLDHKIKTGPVDEDDTHIQYPSKETYLRELEK